MSLQAVIQERNLMIESDRVQHSLNQLAMAQYQYYAEQITASPPAAFATTFKELKDEDVLSVWVEDRHPLTGSDRYSIHVDPISGNLTLKYKADNQSDAGQIAARLGPVAEVVGPDENIVHVTYAKPIDAALMGIFLPRDASLPMTGGPLVTQDLTVKGDLIVEGDTRLVDTTGTGTLTVAGLTELDKGLKVEGGNTWIRGRLDVDGYTRLRSSAVISGRTDLEVLRASSTALFSGELNVVGNGNFVSNVDIQGDIHVKSSGTAVFENKIKLQNRLIGRDNHHRHGRP